PSTGRRTTSASDSGRPHGSPAGPLLRSLAALASPAAGERKWAAPAHVGRGDMEPTEEATEWGTSMKGGAIPVRLDHAVIAVSDWARSNSFYQDVLGAELVELNNGRWAYRFGEQQLNVHGPGAEPHPRASGGCGSRQAG